MQRLTQTTQTKSSSSQVDRRVLDTRVSATAVGEDAGKIVPRRPASGTQNAKANGISGQPRSNLEQSEADWIIDLPVRTHQALSISLHALQEWEGHVVEINESEFVARLMDMTASASYEEEEAVIPRTDLSDLDNERIRLGSVFRWVIGYERSPSGTRKRVSLIVFRDLPVLTGNDIRDARAWACKMAQALNP